MVVHAERGHCFNRTRGWQRCYAHPPNPNSLDHPSLALMKRKENFTSTSLINRSQVPEAIQQPHAVSAIPAVSCKWQSNLGWLQKFIQCWDYFSWGSVQCYSLQCCVYFFFHSCYFWAWFSMIIFFFPEVPQGIILLSHMKNRKIMHLHASATDGSFISVKSTLQPRRKLLHALNNYEFPQWIPKLQQASSHNGTKWYLGELVQWK